MRPWITKLFSPVRKPVRNAPGRVRPHPRLRCEALEDRVAPAAGMLDPSFGTGGKVITNFIGSTNDAARSLVVVQTDGKIVVAGAGGFDFALARYNADGSLDPTFGTGGKVTTDFGNTTDEVFGVALQADGRLVAVGRSSPGGPTFNFALARYNTDGSLDTSFDGDGKVTTDFLGSDEARGVVLQADGKIVAVGFTTVGLNSNFALARYNSNGSLDTSFDGDGKVTTDFLGTDVGNAVAVQADGKIVAAGRNGTGGPGGNFALARYNSNGSLDTSFDTDGKVTTSFGAISNAASALALQADGKIVAVGNSLAGGGGFNFALARYNSNGGLDTSFDTDGKVTTDFALNTDEALGVALQADGKIVAAGRSFGTSGGFNFALARYDSNGGLDTSFDLDGKVTTDFVASNGDSAQDLVAVQADGKIVVAGSSQVGATSTDFALARYNADGSLDTTFGTGGTVTTDFGSSSLERASALVIQADGKIVLAGTSNNTNFALARYNPDGSLDTSFGTGGKVTTNFSNGRINGIALQSDGKIVAAGTSNSDFTLVRYLSNGNLDTSFDTDGIVTTDFTGFADEAFDIILQADGKIVAAGYTAVVGFGLNFALVRYNPNGSLDAGFGTSGKVSTDFATSDDTATGVALRPDGRIVVGGHTGVFPSGSVTTRNFALAQYTAAGALDSTFGTGGKVTTDFAGNTDQGFDLALQADGRVVVAGFSVSVSGTDFALARYTAAGALDSTFGTGGKVTTDFGGNDQAFGVGVQTDGKILAAGFTSIPGAQNFALARYLGADNSPPVAEAGGPYTVAEGGTVLLDGSASTDPDQASGTLTYQWDLDGDNVFGETGAAAGRGNETGVAPTFSAAMLDGPSSVVVSLRVTDNGGLTNTDTATISITNVAPTATLGIAGPTVEGGEESPPLILSFTGASDPSSADTAAGFRYSFSTSVSGLAASYAAAGTDAFQSITFGDNGTYTLFGRIFDKDNGYTDYSTVVTITNVAPTAALGNSGPVGEGSPVTVSFSGASDPSPNDTAAGFRYSFSLSAARLANSYAAAGSATSAPFTFGDNGTYTVYGRIFDKDNGFTDYTTTITVNNVAPTAGVTGPAGGVRGQSRTFTLTATDPSAADQAAGFVYSVNWGDGSPVQTVARTAGNGSGVSLDHVYTATGTYTVQVTATDKDNGTSTAASHTITVTAVALQTDTCDATKTMLVVGGTTGADNIVFNPGGGTGEVQVLLGGVSQGTFSPTGRIVAYGQAGDDHIQVAGGLSLSAWLYGGDGNDRLHGGAGHDMILGGAGDDELHGGQGSDVLIGGTGADNLVGNADGDLLVAGFTTHDASEAALCALLGEWTSSRDYATRVANLRGTGSGPRANGSTFLVADGSGRTAFDDAAVDRLSGSSGQDWIFANTDAGVLDDLGGVLGLELIDDID